MTNKLNPFPQTIKLLKIIIFRYNVANGFKLFFDQFPLGKE